MKKLISRRNFLAAMGTVAAAGVLTACGGSSSGTASSAAASSTATSAVQGTKMPAPKKERARKVRYLMLRARSIHLVESRRMT